MVERVKHRFGKASLYKQVKKVYNIYHLSFVMEELILDIANPCVLSQCLLYCVTVASGK